MRVSPVKRNVHTFWSSYSDMPIESKLESPSRVDIIPNHIGAVGEVLFTARYGPPDAVIDVIHPILEAETPDWIPVESLHIQCIDNSTGEDEFRLYENGETYRWEPDAFIKAWLSTREDPIEWEKETEPPRRWGMQFPVEVKTGSNATLNSNQRRAMELVVSERNKYPLIVRLGIDDMPESYTLTDVQVVTPD